PWHRKRVLGAPDIRAPAPSGNASGMASGNRYFLGSAGRHLRRAGGGAVRGQDLSSRAAVHRAPVFGQGERDRAKPGRWLHYTQSRTDGGGPMNDRFDELRQQYGCGPVQFSGADEALYNRHLLFDHVIDPFKATPRAQFDAMARSLRDIISQRWLLTERTYEQKNPKRVYYLSMEFLLGRMLANNAVNAQLAEIALEVVKGKRNVDPALLETEPDAGLGNGGLGRLAACFLDSMATLALPG